MTPRPTLRRRRASALRYYEGRVPGRSRTGLRDRSHGPSPVFFKDADGPEQRLLVLIAAPLSFVLSVPWSYSRSTQRRKTTLVVPICP